MALPRRFLHALCLVEMTQSICLVMTYPDENLHYLVDLQTTSAEVNQREVRKTIANR